MAALFSQDSTRQRRNTDAIEVSPGVLVAARIAEHLPETQRPFEEAKAEVARKVARREALALARKEGEARLAALAKGDADGLAWTAAKTISRQEGHGIPTPTVRKIMGADAAKLPAYTGAERGDDGYSIYRIAKVIPAAAKSGDQAKESLARYDQQAGSEQLDAYLLSLRAKAKVEVRQANLEQK
jgi:peptidyl-prolyl cis-trans isomerase D